MQNRNNKEMGRDIFRHVCEVCNLLFIVEFLTAQNFPQLCFQDQVYTASASNDKTYVLINVKEFNKTTSYLKQIMHIYCSDIYIEYSAY